MKQRVEIFEDDGSHRKERANILAGNGYELKDQRTYHRRCEPDTDITAVTEHWDDTWWGFEFGIGRFKVGTRPRVSRIVSLAGNHGLPLEPRYGPKHGWRGRILDEDEVKKMNTALHSVANSEAAVDAFRKVGGGSAAFNNATSIGALVMLIPTLGLIGLVAVKAFIG